MAFLNLKPFLHYESFVYRAMLCRSAVICTADTLKLKRHERVNAFNLVRIKFLVQNILPDVLAGMCNR